MKILVVEDEKNLNRIITKHLKMENHSVDNAYNGVEALEYLAVSSYEVLIVDIMMPVMDGLTLVKKLRAEGNRVPVLFLTARHTTADKVAGLDSGGDDYLVKPFDFDELLARLRALVRRQHGSSSNMLALADLTLDMATHKVMRGQELLSLTAKEYEILEYMLRNTGSILSKQQIQDNVWDFSYEGASNMIEVYMSSLRKKIDKDNEVKLLHTVRGSGYVLKA